MKFKRNSIWKPFLGLFLAATAAGYSVAPGELDLSGDEINLVPAPPSESAESTPVVGPPPELPASLGGSSQLPSPPVVLYPKSGSRSVELSWAPSQGPFAIAGYLIYRGESPQSLSLLPINKTPVLGTEFRDDGDSNPSDPPLNRKLYYYGIRAFDLDGRMSPMSEVVAATPNGPLMPPSKVSVAQEDGRVTLRWMEPLSLGPRELSAYQVYRTVVEGQFGAPSALLPSSVTAYDDLAVSNGETYYYVLRSVDDAGNLSDVSPEVRAIPSRSLPTPRKLKARGVGDDSIVLKWENSPGKGTFPIEGYNIYRSTFSPVDLSAAPLNKSLIVDSPRFEDDPDNSTVPPVLGTLYYYRVVAVDNHGGPSRPSEPVAASPTASLTRLSATDVEIPGTASTLSIQGKKTIDMGYTHVVKSDPNALNSYAAGVPEGFTIDQQLQVRLTGKVGRKIKVDVDYDDKALSTEQQKISVVYTGDQQEVFKEFAFGDILMDLNSGRTEFAGYNKHLFGAKVKLETPDGKFRLTAIGAQTKGFTETKRIVGGMEQVKTNNIPGKDVQDIGFTPFRYYYLSREKELVEGNDFIKPGSVEIYIDRPGDTVYDPNKIVVNSSDGQNKFNFVRLTPNEQYSVDMQTGLVTFNNVAVPANASIAVAFIKVRGGVEFPVGYSSYPTFDFTPANMDSNVLSGKTTDSKHLIQYGSRYTSQYDGHMSLQVYSLGYRDILNPQLDPDFKMIIYGSDQRPIYELDHQHNFSDVVGFDPRQGAMIFRVPYPFKKGLANPSDLKMDPGFNKSEDTLVSGSQDAYNQTQPIHNYTVHLEFKYKVSSYSLRFNIIRGSEFITLDGRRLARDVDYFLDYDTGILVFSNPDMIKDNSVIDATYEYLPFGGSFTSTIWGTRAEYDVAKNLSIGSTFILNSSDSPLETPELRSTPYSLALLDGDILATFSKERLSDILSGLTGDRKIPLAITVKGEVAHSWYNPNTFNQHNESGVAMMDNFESVDNVVSVTTEENSWFPSSRPITSNSFSDKGLPRADRVFSKQGNVTIPGHDAKERTGTENPNRTMMMIHYDKFINPQKWDSFVTPFTGSNKNLQDYTYIEVWVKTENPITLNIDVGRVNEDATDNLQMDTESTTGILKKGQDIGFWNSNSGSCGGSDCYPLPDSLDPRYVDPNYWGKDNRVVDTEDLDGTGSLDMTNSFYRFSRRITKVNNPDTMDFQLIQIPLTNAQIFDPSNTRKGVPGDLNFYADIRHVRLWINEADSTGGGTIYIESIQFKGSKWQIRSDPRATTFGVSNTADTYKFQVNTINTQTAASVAAWADAPTSYYAYSPNIDFFRSQTSTDKNREQSLQVEYRLTTQDQTNGAPNYMARRILATGQTLDLGDYKNLRLDLFKPHENMPGEELLLRVGVDDDNYFEYHILLDQVPFDHQWHSVTLALDGSDGRRKVRGQPFLRNVKFVALAVLTYNQNLKNDEPHLDKGRELLWLNNLRLTDTQGREGTAYKINLVYDVAGMVQVTEDYREIESDFIRVDTQGDPPKRHDRVHSVGLNSAAVSWMPVNLRWENRQSVTEIERRDDPAYSRNFVDPDETANRLEGTVGFNVIPKLSISNRASYLNSRDEYLQGYVDAQHTLSQRQGLDHNFLPHYSNKELNVSQTYGYTVPTGVPFLKNDQFSFDWNFMDTSRTFDRETTDAQTNFKNNGRRQRSYHGRYSAQYRLVEGLSLSPAYDYTYRDAQGKIPVPSLSQPKAAYYDLGSDFDTKDPSSGVDDYQPQYREIRPDLTLQYDKSKFIRTPRAVYSFRQSRDYVRNELRSPGSLELSGNVSLSDMFGNSKAPDIT
ncbi:MAG: hypothetical protein V4498_04785, partial [candidate division FCPU426 bacterium]